MPSDDESYNPDAPFNPDWTSPPGDTIKDILREKKIPLIDLANHLDMSLLQAEALLRGDEQITTWRAMRLAEMLGSNPEFWMNREAQYRYTLYERETRRV